MHEEREITQVNNKHSDKTKEQKTHIETIQCKIHVAKCPVLWY